VALVRTILTNSLIEIGYLAPGETPNAAIAAIGLSWLQRMIDGWAANRLTLSTQLRTTFTLTSGTSSVTLGLSGATVTMARPMYLNAVNYVIPASTPGVEVPIGIMDEDAYSSLSIKSLPSAYPLQCFYQTDVGDENGTLFFWPQVTGNITIALYTAQAVSTPTSLDTDLLGPAGYQDAFHYGLAMRLVTPCAVTMPPSLPQLAASALNTMMRPNMDPGQLSVDPAVVPNLGAGYNILSDVTATSRN
jgi:hypothetical protein